MARTYRKDAKKNKDVNDGEYVSTYYQKECKEVRVRSARDIRHDTKRALYEGEYDSLPEYQKTSGWETH